MVELLVVVMVVVRAQHGLVGKVVRMGVLAGRGLRQAVRRGRHSLGRNCTERRWAGAVGVAHAILLHLLMIVFKGFSELGGFVMVDCISGALLDTASRGLHHDVAVDLLLWKTVRGLAVFFHVG